MATKKVSGGVSAHKLPTDLKQVLLKNPKSLAAWEDITPLARNEWICWTIFVKKADTRKEHVTRAVKELAEGKRRPCCWLGCTHRKDKTISPTQKWVLGKSKA